MVKGLLLLVSCNVLLTDATRKMQIPRLTRDEHADEPRLIGCGWLNTKKTNA